MANLARYAQKIFASTAGTNKIAQFGSLAAASPARYTGAAITPDIVQGLSNWLTGWNSAVEGDNAIALEDLEAVCYLFSYQLAYIMQKGIPEWNSTTTYYIGHVVLDPTSGKVYQSLTNSNLNNALTSTSNWKVLVYNPAANLGDILYSAANGVPAALAAPTTADQYYLTQTGTGSGGAIPAWKKYVKRTRTILTSGSGSYVPPTGCTAILVRMVGGGGGGGTATGGSGTAGAGAGGQAGNYVEQFLNSLAGSYSYGVGSGGSSASNGTDTTFGTYTASGGLKGNNDSSPGSTVSLGGLGQGILVGSLTGDIVVYGRAGGNGLRFSGTNCASGSGGECPLGQGGLGSVITTNNTGNSNNAPQGYGGGGGGAAQTGTGSTAGGAGSNGVIIIDEFYQ